MRPHSGWGFGAWRERRTAPVAPGVDRGRDRGALEQDGLSRAGVDDVRGEDDRMRRVAHDPPMPLFQGRKKKKKKKKMEVLKTGVGPPAHGETAEASLDFW